MKSTEYHVRSPIGSVVQSPTENVLAGPRLPLDGLVAQSTDLVYTSGHYVTMNGSSDYASDTPTFPSAVADIELLARSTSDGSFPTTYGTGTFDANGTWQNVSITTPAKEYGDKMWFDGVNDSVNTGGLTINAGDTFNLSIDVFLSSKNTNYGRLFFTSTFQDFEAYYNNGLLSVYYGAIGGLGIINASIQFDDTIKTLEVDYDGSVLRVYENGNIKGARSISPNNISGSFFIGTGASNYFAGLFSRLQLTVNGTIQKLWDGTTSDASNQGWSVNGSPQTVSTYYSTNALEIGRSGSDYFAGDVANVNFKNASGTIIGSWLMGSNDAGTLTDLPEFDRSGNGNHLAYTGCTSVLGEGPDEDVWGLEEYEEYMWFDGVDDRVDLPSTYTMSVGEYLEYKMLAGSTTMGLLENLPTAVDYVYQIGFRINNVPYNRSSTPSSGVLVVRLERIDGSTYRHTVNDSSEDFTSSDSISLDSIMGSAGINLSKMGLVWDVDINGTVYQGTGNDSAAWNGATVIGNPLTVADKLRTIPQTGLLDWNKAINFNEAGSVSLGSGDPLGFSGASKIEFRGWVYVTGTVPTIVSPFFSYYVTTGATGFSVVINNSGDIRVAGRSEPSDTFQTYAISISDGWHYVKTYLDYANKEAGISIDDGTYNTSSLSFGQNVFTPTTNTNTNNIAEVESVSGAIYNSIIRDVEIWVDDVKTDSWTLYGINDLENKTGSVDGTLVGSPAENLLPSSLTNPSVDALGNTIDDPRNNLLNHTGWNTDRAVIPYDPSLNATTEAEWFIWGNFYIDDGVAQTKKFVDRYDFPNIDGVFFFGRSSDSSGTDGEVQVNLGDPTTGNFECARRFIVSNNHSLIRMQYNGSARTLKWAEYNNGSWTDLVNMTNLAGNIPANLYTTDIPIYLPGTYATDPLQHWEGQQSPLFMYNRILDDKEVESIRKSTEKLYGQ